MMPPRNFGVITLLSFVVIVASNPSVSRADETPGAEKTRWVPDSAGYEKIIVPFLSSYCQSCHVGTKAKGSFRTDTGVVNDFIDPAASETWSDVVNVLNGHEMPPKKAKQPGGKEVAAVVDWITAQSVRAEQVRRDRAVVLRRMNRDEYRNTIHDLIGVDFDISLFPEDPPAGGFDNNGRALTMSPLLVELYMTAARQILDQALVVGERPRPIKWRFRPRNTPPDKDRQRLDANTIAVVNGGEVNRMEGDFVVVHHNVWNAAIGSRGYHMPVEGTYVIRIHAAGRIPSHEQVIAAAQKLLVKRRLEANAKYPDRARDHEDSYQRDLAQFQDRMYDYGPPRIKLSLQLGPIPRVIDEFDVDGTVAEPKIYERRVRFTKEEAGVVIENVYSVPSVGENFWMLMKEGFARPELLLDWFEIEGPINETWPPPTHTAILYDPRGLKLTERQYARDVLSRFMRKAYRRPVTEAEIDSKMKLYDRARKGKNFLESIKLPLTAILSSPNFLYLVEPANSSPGQPKTLDNFELASRLSYFLWSSMLDRKLWQLADKGQLTLRATRAEEVDRMLADPRSDEFVNNFAGQWLGLREVGNNPPVPDLFPRYDRHLEVSIVRESEEFFKEILKNDLDARDLVKSDYVIVNERLARFYGIKGVRGDSFRKVHVPASVHRGGIATQASILTITSNGTRTSPVKRGTWVLKTLLGTDPGLPVANVGEIAPKIKGIERATVRQRLEIHRDREQCARCHNKIDPLGFALENYNAGGEWRDHEGFGYKGKVDRGDPKIDASSNLPDGTRLVGVEGLQKAILEREDLFLGCLASKMFTYALGRELGLSDQPTVAAAVASMKKNKYTLRSLIKFIVTSELFENK